MIHLLYMSHENLYIYGNRFCDQNELFIKIYICFRFIELLCLTKNTLCEIRAKIWKQKDLSKALDIKDKNSSLSLCV